MNILITICARGGSKGVPGKNIKNVGGNPLIYYSLALADKFKQKNKSVDIILSTDSEEIKSVVKDTGIKNIDLDYVRPEVLAADTVGKLEAVQDVLLYKEKKEDKKYDYLLDLDVTAPFRTVEDLEKAFELLENSDAYNIFSVNPANRNPYFNMVEENARGYCSLCKKGEFLTRQSAPKVYDMNASFYIYKRKFFDENLKSAITDKSLVYVMNHICFDLDHVLDFEFMDYLIANNKLEFDFGQY